MKLRHGLKSGEIKLLVLERKILLKISGPVKYMLSKMDNKEK